MSQPTSPSAPGANGTGPVRTSAKKAVKSGPATMTLQEERPAPASVPPASAASDSSAPAAEASTPRPGGPRRVRLSVSRVDPWSVMKLGFLLSVAAGIVTVVAAAVSWQVLDSMGVFADLSSLVSDLGATAQFGPILEYLKLNNIMSMAVIVAVVNVALITALATLFAFLYNIVAALVGGLHMTLTDD